MVLVRAASVSSPYLFTRYVRELIASIMSSRIGCNCNIGARV
jgi:hypothetical protein